MSAKTAPPGWICVDGGGSAGTSARIYRSPDGSRWGLHYEAHALDGVYGVIWTQSTDEARLMHLQEAPNAGFVVLAGTPVAGPIGILFYHSGLSTSTPALSGADHQHIWSLYQGQPWLIHEMETMAESYFVQGAAAIRSNGVDHYAPLPISMSGADFELEISFQKGFQAYLEYGTSKFTCR